MQLNEFHTFNIKDAVKFHKELNPKLFNPNNKMDPEVRDQLLLIAKDFVTNLGISDLNVEDVTVSGSNAAYSYTDHSDIDLHIVVDFDKLPDDEVYQELFTAKKTIYNDSHDITVRGIPVELYVQDSNQPHVTLGEYSIVNDKWTRIPTKDRANFNQRETKSKYEKLLDFITRAIKTQDYDKVIKATDIVKRYRQAGLDKAGEFGPENLAYKALRNQGYIQKLYDTKNKLHSQKLSIDEMGEDYDPNGPPPGPEFKPTMPAGTVRVDVSDVYDWYKLGQNISNLDKVDKSQFGKGPPSTIMAFGSEELEHKYINALKQLGLDTTDIDPVDKNQPKGMPRQKVDPTYNVNEWKKSINSYSDIILFLRKAMRNPSMMDQSGSKIVKGLTGDSTTGLKELNRVYMKDFRSWDEVWNAMKVDYIRGLRENASDAKFVYHVTPTKNLKSIAKQGLTPNMGNRSSKISGEQKGIYVFPDKVSAEDAVMNWLGDEFDDEPLTMLKIDVSGLEKDITKGADYELVINKTIEPTRIKKVKIDLGESASGYIPSYAEKDDPRFSTALTVDIKPDSLKKNAKAFGFDISRAGIPPDLSPSGKYKRIKKK